MQGINTRNDQRIKLNDEQVDDVDEFLYLGALLDKDGGATKDIQRQTNARQLSTGCEEFGTLAKLAGRRKFNCSKRL